MAMRIYFREQPRTLLLATDEYALSFHCVNDSTEEKSSNYTGKPAPDNSVHGSGNSAASRVLVDFTSRETIDITRYRPLSSLPCYGCLGLLNVDGDVFLAVITRSSKVAEPVADLETVYRIHALEFYCVSRATWDFVVWDPAGNPLDTAGGGLMTSGDTIDLATASGGGAAGTPAAGFIEHPCGSLRKLLTDGSFYYSNNFDLTNHMQSRSVDPTFDIDGFDEAFMWNSYMISELVTYRSHLQPDEKAALDQSRFLTSAIRGFAETVPTQIGATPATLTVISRQGCRRAGTRYNARGVDDEGNVANFVETETILHTAQFSFSYTQIRGSVPIFWEQDVQLLSAKVNITRAFEATQPAFMAHFEPVVTKYGPVHIVNLLSTKPGEHELTQRYHQHIRQASHSILADQLRETQFDFHVETAKAGYVAANRIIRFLADDAEEFGFFLHDNQTKSTTLEQTGVFRTNCLDCLDRTNLIQQIISRLALEMFFEQQETRPGNDLWIRHSVLWADNGDQLSKIYAGTGALKTSFTRSGKMSIAGAIADATKSVSRMYINNFVDKGRQNTMDVLLGRLEGQQPVVLHDPINDYVLAELNKRKSEFTSSREISILAGTFNLNGFLYEGDLSAWLFPPDSGIQEPDLVIVAFQEIVELTAGQILSADPAKRQFWEHQVSRCLKAHGDYVLLRSGQLVGTALLMYLKASEVRSVRNINGAMKKTGLGGMAGNKGGVAFSCDYASTKLCFITSHFAAGMSNVEDRNNDYRTIARGIRFPRGKTLKDHDTVVWLGDFNYRIDLPNEDVRRHIKLQNLEELYRHDQLNNQMLNGQVFPFFSESQISFNPTYKFDNGTDAYDSSDKSRIPAWTDRILTRGSNIKQIAYNCAKLKFSDHRPVYASFKVTVHTVNEPVKEKLSQELYAQRRGYVGQLLDLDGGDSEKLPPPSTDKNKWWNNGGQAARVTIGAPRPNMIVNPYRPANPFSPTTQPDFISRDALASTRTSAYHSYPEQIAAAAAASSLAHHSTSADLQRPPPIPRKPNSLSGTSLHSLSSVLSSSPDEEVPPALPPRRTNTTGSSSSRSGLLDFDTPRDTPLQTFPSSNISRIGRPESRSNGTAGSPSRASSTSSTSSGPLSGPTIIRRAEFPSTSLPKISRSPTQPRHNGDAPPPLPLRHSQTFSVSGSSSTTSVTQSSDPRFPVSTSTFTSTGANRSSYTSTTSPALATSTNTVHDGQILPPKLPPRPSSHGDSGGTTSAPPAKLTLSSAGLLDDEEEEEVKSINSSWKALA
ncbi:SacI homology domain-containing protein [Lipomyces doorenjongii]|uniref:SacI homology domain-containing protein n=1 Tax=Lipomyces doorenjongii TaxID=383834 RepID=UPI0034CDFBD6